MLQKEGLCIQGNLQKNLASQRHQFNEKMFEDLEKYWKGRPFILRRVRAALKKVQQKSLGEDQREVLQS